MQIHSFIHYTVTLPFLHCMRSYEQRIGEWNWGSYELLIKALRRAGDQAIWMLLQWDRTEQPRTSNPTTLYTEENRHTGYHRTETPPWRKTRLKQKRAELYRLLKISERDNKRHFMELLRKLQYRKMALSKKMILRQRYLQ